MALVISDLLTLPEQTIFVKGGNIPRLIKHELGLDTTSVKLNEVNYEAIVNNRHRTLFRAVECEAVEAFLQEVKDLLYYDPTKLEFYIRMQRLKDSFIYIELNDMDEILSIYEIDEDEYQNIFSRCVYSHDDSNTVQMSDYLEDLLGLVPEE